MEMHAGHYVLGKKQRRKGLKCPIIPEILKSVS